MTGTDDVLEAMRDRGWRILGPIITPTGEEIWAEYRRRHGRVIVIRFDADSRERIYEEGPRRD